MSRNLPPGVTLLPLCEVNSRFARRKRCESFRVESAGTKKFSSRVRPLRRSSTRLNFWFSFFHLIEYIHRTIASFAFDLRETVKVIDSHCEPYFGNIPCTPFREPIFFIESF